MGYKIQDSDIGILRSSGVSEEDIAHCKKVAEKALEIAERTGANIDFELVGRGALFHDLGKSKTHEMEHGKIGAELGRQIGLPQAITDIMEKHIRGGLTEPEAIELGLPVKDYTLKRLEERIVIYADRLVDIITDGIVTINDELEAETRFETILQTIPKYGKNEITLQRYLGYHREIQGLMNK
ncbi:MAG: HDIG domain-containing protein [Nitrospirae bacterium]|nr:HDIG domain-containing protein [Nitrospirota bacterium]